VDSPTTTRPGGSADGPQALEKDRDQPEACPPRSSMWWRRDGRTSVSASSGADNVPERVLRAMDRAVPDHRGPVMPPLPIRETVKMRTGVSGHVEPHLGRLQSYPGHAVVTGNDTG
jgi:hypothetical protein